MRNRKIKMSIGIFVLIVLIMFSFAFFPEYTISILLLPIYPFIPDIIPFLKKREKKTIFHQISFLKKKLRRKKWRKIFEECLMDCRTEDVGDDYYGELYGDNKYLRPSFREFWSLSSNSSFFSEKEREWIGEIEGEVEERLKEMKEREKMS